MKYTPGIMSSLFSMQHRRWFLALLPGFVLMVLLTANNSPAQSVRPGMGATPYSDSGGGVTFRVWSPNATNVAVRGSFNGWGVTPMLEEGSSDLWSVDVPGATAGAQYKYYFNNAHWWKDPRGRQVTYSGYDSSGANSIVYNPAAFNWAGDTRLAVTNSNLVIYEMHIGS